ncbi:MAG: hypothetical protein IJG84_05990 [Kiritimatiellae bacterium]|nr:hypothetical protein [Kiritimatiellia bacterium]
MKTKELQDVRRRSEIIGEIAAIPSAVQGKICEMRKHLSGGKVATYYNLQHWADGRNHTMHIPRGKLARFRDAVSGGEKLKRLVSELAEADARDILSFAPLEKARRDRAQGHVRAERACGAGGGQRRHRRDRLHQPAGGRAARGGTGDVPREGCGYSLRTRRPRAEDVVESGCKCVVQQRLDLSGKAMFTHLYVPPPQCESNDI